MNAVTKILCLVPLVSLLGAALLPAAVQMTIRELPGAVRVEYAGTLDTTGGSWQGGLSSSYSRIEGPKLLFLGEQNWEFDSFPTGGAQRWFIPLTGFTTSFGMNSGVFAATSALGDSFGFNAFDSGGPQLNTRLPGFYTPSDANLGMPFTGSMEFAGASFSSLGLTEGEGFRFDLANGDNVSALVVPEPSTMVGVLVLLTGALIRRERGR